MSATGERKKLRVDEVLRELPVRGIRKIAVKADRKSPARTAVVELRYSTICIPRPKVLTPWLKEHTSREPLLMGIVELREPSPPKGITPLRWVLYTSDSVNTIADAETAIFYY